MGDIRSRVDSVWAIHVVGHVSGTASGLTGTLDASSNLNIVVSYPTGSVPSIPSLNAAPTGSVLIQLPLGNQTGIVKDQLAQTYKFSVNMEPGSGSDRTMDARAANGISMFRAIPIAHNTVSGSYLFAFQNISGSAGYVFQAPVDPVNPSSMACRWDVEIVGRKTTRRQ